MSLPGSGQIFSQGTVIFEQENAYVELNTEFTGPDLTVISEKLDENSRAGSILNDERRTTHDVKRSF